jgi:hypothetical protein
MIGQNYEIMSIPVSKNISNEFLKFELKNGIVPALNLQLKPLILATNVHIFPLFYLI